MNTITDLGINPKTFEREAECQDHGAYTERGGSLTGKIDRVKWFGCRECNRIEREREEEAARAKEEAVRQARIESRMKASGIPIAFRDRTFESFIVENGEMQHALEVARDFADNFWSCHAKEGGFLVFGGITGTGKSHLALAAAQQVMRRGTAMYLDAMDLIRRVRGTWRKDSDRSEDQMMEMLGGGIDLLIIDEVGVQRGTEDEQMILFDVINRRYRDLRPTILLTNLSGKAFIEFVGPRVMSRLNERAQFVRFNWPDWRLRGVA